MESKLLIIVSKSSFDWEILREKPGYPKRFINYVECDSGRICSTEPIPSERLLCTVRLMDGLEKNTERVGKVIDQCAAWEKKVVGTHTRLEDPKTVLYVDQLEAAIPFHNYSTGSNVYAFVQEWCKSLAQASPAPQKIVEGYDKLFQYLAQRVPAWPSDTFSEIKHDLENVLLPLRTRFSALIQTDFDEGYLNRIRSRPISPFDKARGLLYSSPSSLFAEAEIAARTADPQQAARIRSLLGSLSSLIPQSDNDSSSGILFQEMLRFLSALADQSVRREQVRQLVPLFTDWEQALLPVLDELGRLVNGALGSSARAASSS